jgi:hypothetical protein
VTRDGLIGIVDRLLRADCSEEERPQLLDLLERSVPHPTVSDLIFYPVDGVELTAAEIVDRALAYEPTALAALLEP